MFLKMPQSHRVTFFVSLNTNGFIADLNWRKHFKMEKITCCILNIFKYIRTICSLWSLFINRTLNKEHLHVSTQLSLPNSKCSKFKHHFEVCASLLSTTDSLVFAGSSHFRCGLRHVSLQRYKARAGIRKIFDRSEYRWKNGVTKSCKCCHMLL